MLPKALADGDGNALASECQAAHRALPIGAPSGIISKSCCISATKWNFRKDAALTVAAAFGINAPGSGVWMSGKEGVVAVTCLALEAGIARGPGVSVICNQSSGLRAALR